MQLKRFFEKKTRGIRSTVPFKGGNLNVCRKNNLGDTSDRWFHHVYFIILFYFIDRYPFGKDHLLQKAI